MAIFFFVTDKSWNWAFTSTSLLPSSFTLTLLMLLPEREYGRWTNTGAYYWWSQWEGSVSKPLYKPVKKKERDTNQPLPARQGSWLHGEPSARSPPFHQLYSSSSNQLKDRDLICCHSSPACFFFFFFSDDRRGTRAAVELMWTKRGRKISRLPKIPHWAEKQSLGIRKGRRKR